MKIKFFIAFSLALFSGMASSSHHIASEAGDTMEANTREAPATMEAISAMEATSSMEAPVFSDIDQNRDGLLDGEDVSNIDRLAEQFRQADRNGDARLNPAEYKAYMQLGTPAR